ncbi:MAG: cysteine desulfurase [Ignavibacteria bacterium]|nr:cysteine desulfurase [Ignavibacteria bacterium]
MIYLDNSATTQMDDEVLTAMLPWLREDYGNASSIYALGRRARVAIEQARADIAACINAHPAEIFFTSGGTEANNTVLKSCVDESDLADTIAVGATEHHAILHPLEILAHKYPTAIIPVDEQGLIKKEIVHTYNAPRTLISIMHANNETGIIQPIQELRSLCPEALLHTDAVQSFGKIPFDVQQLGVDFASFSAHKIHGPKGIGALFIRKGIDFKAHQQGGGQERNRRAGTEATALIVGFALAAKKAYTEMEQRAKHTYSMISLLREELRNIEGLRCNTPEDNTLPTIINFSLEHADTIDGEAILQSLDIAGIAASNGSACVSGSMQSSHVLLAMGRSKAEAKAAVRFSVSRHTTKEEIQTAAAALKAILISLRG